MVDMVVDINSDSSAVGLWVDEISLGLLFFWGFCE